MKIFQLHADVDDYNYFGFMDKKELKNKTFNGKELLSDWVQPEIQLYRTKKYHLGDIAMLMTLTPVINNTVIEIFKDMFANSIELLPVLYSEPVVNKYIPKGPYYLMNVINVIDALDEGKSEFERYDDGRIMFCTKYFFREDIIGNNHIFKIPQFPTVDILVTEEFVKRVEENDLKGFVFEELWNSEK